MHRNPAGRSACVHQTSQISALICAELDQHCAATQAARMRARRADEVLLPSTERRASEGDDEEEGDAEEEGEAKGIGWGGGEVEKGNGNRLLSADIPAKS
ncbi:unnamed protein product [Prorocentrum cordatum]|uniref:Uncharacterized protein n=1 Tax=Prorocentrum cordatum TaxID=2364126 RepID=A0ABN9XSR4_9DINO|nr:unnamed protein product [Polarella glacialis]